MQTVRRAKMISLWNIYDNMQSGEACGLLCGKKGWHEMGCIEMVRWSVCTWLHASQESHRLSEGSRVRLSLQPLVDLTSATFLLLLMRFSLLTNSDYCTPVNFTPPYNNTLNPRQPFNWNIHLTTPLASFRLPFVGVRPVTVTPLYDYFCFIGIETRSSGPSPIFISGPVVLHTGRMFWIKIQYCSDLISNNAPQWEEFMNSAHQLDLHTTIFITLKETSHRCLLFGSGYKQNITLWTQKNNDQCI